MDCNGGVSLMDCNGEDDHVHLLVEYPAEGACLAAVSSLKGMSARKIRPRYPIRIHRQQLWSSSYPRRLFG